MWIAAYLPAMGNRKVQKQGYNPSKRGRNSHHPLFAFVKDIRMVANCWNRSGNTSSSSNCINFLEETFGILKSKKIGLFLADSGFCSEAMLKYIEDKQIAYVMSCKLYANLQSTIYDIASWQQVGMGIWITEIEFRQGGWSMPRRIVIIKQLEEVRKKTTGKRLTSLFKLEDIDRDKVYKTRYHAFVCNQQLPAVEIWEQYKRRGHAEIRIKELKEDFGVQGFCMDDFCATETAMRFVMVAYNLMSFFRLLTLQKQPCPTLSTVRFNGFAVGSWIENKVLKMSVPLKRR